MQKVQGCILLLIMFIFSKQELRKTSQVSAADEFAQVVQCYSIKCKKRNHKYCVSRTKLFTSDDFELNPGPVVTQGNNPDNLIELLQSRLPQHALRILDGGAGDCFFRVVSQQLYGEATTPDKTVETFQCNFQCRATQPSCPEGTNSPPSPPLVQCCFG